MVMDYVTTIWFTTQVSQGSLQIYSMLNPQRASSFDFLQLNMEQIETTTRFNIQAK